MGQFVRAVAISGTINVTATLLISAAYARSEVSVIAPLAAFSPGLTAISGFLIVGEMPSVYSILGIILIIIGVFFVKNQGNTLLAPIRNLLNDTGAVIMLVVILMYSVSSVYDKIGVEASSPIFWTFFVFGLTTVMLFPIMMYMADDPLTEVAGNGKVLALFSCLGGVYVLIQMWAIQQTLVVYVISLKRMSILVAIALSYVFLDDEEITRRRVFGVVLMVAGSVIVSVFV